MKNRDNPKTSVPKIPLLSLFGVTKTEKFWVSPDGEIFPLKGLWHYQWALGNRQLHGINLKGETEENPVRLLMLSGGWWRMNFERKSCQLTIEGELSGINFEVEESIKRCLYRNQRNLNAVSLHILDGESLIRKSFLSFTDDLPLPEIEQWVTSVFRPEDKYPSIESSDDTRKVADKSESNREPIKWKTEDFKMEHDGVVITAEVEWWAKDISVTLVEPWKGLSEGRHNGFCFPQTSFNLPDKRDETIRRLVVELYETGKVIDAHRDRLSTMINWHDDHSFAPELVAFVEEKTREARRKSRAELRAGRIDGPAHQQTMGYLRKLSYAAGSYRHLQEDQLSSDIARIIGEHSFLRRYDPLRNVRKMLRPGPE